jgi:hypothetical protein
MENQRIASKLHDSVSVQEAAAGFLTWAGLTVIERSVSWYNNEAPNYTPDDTLGAEIQPVNKINSSLNLRNIHSQWTDCSDRAGTEGKGLLEKTGLRSGGK